MKTKISKRDVAIFLLGFFTMFLIDVILDWNDNVASFKKGSNDARNAMNKEISK